MGILYKVKNADIIIEISHKWSVFYSKFQNNEHITLEISHEF